MKNKIKRTAGLLILLTGLALLLFWPARPALACSVAYPSGYRPPTLQDRFRAAQLVFEGTVTEVPPRSNSFDNPAGIRVHRYYKGQGPPELVVGGFGAGASCKTDVMLGQRLVFYIKDVPGDGWQALYLEAFKTYDPADPDVLAELAGLNSPAPPLTPAEANPLFKVAPKAGVKLEDAPLYAGCGIMSALLLSLAALVWLYSRKKRIT